MVALRYLLKISETFKEVIGGVGPGDEVGLQSPLILVPRPCRLRDEKRGMGTRMGLSLLLVFVLALRVFL